MPNWTKAEYVAHLAKQPVLLPQAPSNAAKREMDLHDRIMEYCNSRFPRWKFIRARSDQKSTIAIGAADFTIFLPGGRTLCVECKTRDGKMSNEQLSWAAELRMLGHIVHVVRSIDEFTRLVDPTVTEIKDPTQPKLSGAE